MVNFCCCFRVSDEEADYLPLPMSPGPSRDFDPVTELLLLTSNGAINFSLTADGLAIVKRKKGLGGLNLKPSNTTHLLLPYLQIVSATSQGEKVTVATVQTRSATQSAFRKYSGTVSSPDEARFWCEKLMERAYSQVKPGRRFLVVVNPHGGPGKGKSVWEQSVKPLLAAAGCTVDLQFTGPKASPQHATQIAKRADMDSLDAIISVSGDGIIHELLNGLATRPDAAEALRRLPVVPVPAGSGNAITVNLLGPKRSRDVVWATLAAIKGLATPLDLCAVTQDGKQYYAFLSATFGIMADLDLGTEHLRWMGDNRFVVGFVQGVMQARKYPVELLLHVVESDREKMAVQYNSTRNKARPEPEPLDQLPSLKYGSSTSPLPGDITTHTDMPEYLPPGWHLLKCDTFLGNIGKLPFIAEDFQTFPVANTPGPSLIDVGLLGPTPRLECLSLMDGGEKGALYWNKNLRYYKVDCMRYTNMGKASNLVAIDGERVPSTPWQLESWGGVARVLALDGKFYNEELKKP